MSCTNTNLYASLKKCPGKALLPGLKKFIFGIRKDQIASWPSFASSPTTLGAIAKLTGNFTLVSDAEFHVIEIVENKSNLVCASQGEKPSVTALNTLTAVVAMTNDEATAYVAQAANDDLVYIVGDKEGNYRLIGNEMYETNVTYEQNTGSQATDEMGTTLTIAVTDKMPAPFYSGTLVTEDGTFDCATGKFTAGE